MEPNISTVYLVACVRQKRDMPSVARDLYVSNLFRKARKYAEASGCRWFVLSAEYGLVEPTRVIAPYDRTLNKKMSLRDRRAWAERVVNQLTTTVPEFSKAVFLAGKRYREILAGLLIGQGISVSVPMEGLRIGEQLSWLKRQFSDEGR